MIKAVLKSVLLFKRLDDDELDKLIGITEEEKYCASDRIFNEDDIGNKLYIIKEGSVEILKKVVLDEENIVARLEKGNFFGEMSLIENLPRSASARSFDLTKLITISKSDFDNFMESNHDIAYKIHKNIISELCHRIRNTTEQVQEKIMWGFSSND